MRLRLGARPNAGVAMVALAVIAAATGCSNGRTVDVPEVDAIAAPTFESRPDDLADSGQLDALETRDNAGLEPTTVSADPSLLAPALAALAAIDDPPSALTRLSIYDDDVTFGFYENGVTGRYVSANYWGDRDELYVGEPTFNDEETFPLSVIDPVVAVQLVDAIEQRFPGTVVASMDIDVDLSYEFGLAWYIRVDDARGSLATVFADPDGSIIAVDPY